MYIRRHIPILILFFLSFFQAEKGLGQCICPNCPVYIPNLDQTDIDLNISGATNNVIGQNGQALCGVSIHMQHKYIGDLLMTLTAPNGTSVTLMGDIDMYGATDGTTWDIDFVPCSQAAAPDGSFADIFSNANPWGNGGFYGGSYHPYLGCLEDFAGSAVNGTWTLSILDNQDFDDGNLLNFELIFCDATGIDCLSCEADAGNLTQPNTAGCEGDQSVNLTLPPTYPTGINPPPAVDYTYSYIVSSSIGIVESIQSDADLTTFPIGNYTVCGLSYLTSQSALVPAPNGSLTTAQLRAQLGSGTPPFCGDVTSNCVNINILPPQPDTYDTLTLCQGQCTFFNGTLLCTPGDYSSQLSQNNCNYTSFLHLEITPPPSDTIRETICSGTCSQTQGFATACVADTFSRTVQTIFGCDSIVVLILDIIDVEVGIATPDTISCSDMEVDLFGTNSSTGVDVNYTWTTIGGSFLGATNQIDAQANSVGSYTLEVCRNVNGKTCCLDSIITVIGTLNPPNEPSPIVGPDTVCVGDVVTYMVNPMMNIDSFDWQIPSNATLITGQGTNSVSIQWDAAPGDLICVHADNGCGSSTDACLNVVVLENPQQPPLSGLDTACAGVPVLYETPVNLGVSFEWSVMNGMINFYNTDSSQATVLWDSGVTTGEICLSVKNSCGQSTDSCITVSIDAPPSQPGLSGFITACHGDTMLYQLTPSANVIRYNWSVVGSYALIDIDSFSFIELVWDSGSVGTVCVSAENDCGNSMDACIQTQLYEVPVAMAGISDSICGQDFTLNALSPSIGIGVWQQNSGAGTTVFSDVNSASSTASVDAFGVYNYNWIVSNNSCVDTASVQIEFNENPSIGQAMIACLPTNDSFVVSFPIIGGTPSYSVGSQLVSASSFISNPIQTGQGYSFVVTDSKGCSSTILDGTHDCSCITNAGTMDLSLIEVCLDGNAIASFNNDSILDANDIGIYYLHDGSGTSLGTVFSENTTGSFTIQNGMVAGQTYYISIGVGNGNGLGGVDVNDPCFSLAQGQPVIFWDYPTASAGVDADTCGLSVELNAANPTGTWSILQSPPSSNPTISDTQLPSTTFSSDMPGTYRLEWLVSENGCAHRDTIDVMFNSNPMAIALDDTCYPTNDSFVVSFTVSSGAAPYMVNGQAITGTMYSSSALASGQSYEFIIEDVNGCISDTIRGTRNCACTTDAGTMAQDTLKACADGIVSAGFNNDANPDPNDVGIYMLHDGSGASLGTVFLQNGTGNFAYDASLNFGTTYYISYVLGTANSGGLVDLQDPCLSVAIGRPIVFYPYPNTNAGFDIDTCSLDIQLNASNSQGTWTILSAPFASNGVFSDAQSPTSTFTADSTGNYELVWAVSENGCTVSDFLEIEVFDSPIIVNPMDTCSMNLTEYSLSFSIQGGSAPYIVNGVNGTLVGLEFESDFIANGTPYAVQIQDANGCQSDSLKGVVNCACGNSAGTMTSLLPLELCEGEAATALYNNDEIVNSDELLQFVLHDGSGTLLGTVFDIQNQPTFSYSSSLVFGQNYYISAVVGEDIAGAVDFTDPCLNVAVGTPVQWRQKPSAILPLDTTICSDQNLSILIRATGIFPINIQMEDDAGTPYSLQANNAPGAVFSFSPTMNTTLSILSVSDGGNPSCINDTIYNSLIINVNEAVSANVEDSVSICNSSQFGSDLDFSNLIINGDASGNWTNLSGVGTGSIPNLDFDGVAAGIYLFEYQTAAAISPCSNPVFEVKVNVLDCLCPPINITQQATICTSNPTLNLNDFELSGVEGNWMLESQPIGSNSAVLVDSILQIFEVDTGQYSLAFFPQNPGPMGCPDSAVLDLILVAPADAGLPFAPLSFCEKLDTLIDLSSLLNGADNGGQWTEVSSSLSQGGFEASSGLFNPNNEVAAAYHFQYKINSIAPCPSDSVKIEVNLVAVPQIDLGSQQNIGCTQSSVTLSPLNPIQNGIYQWYNDGVLINGANVSSYSTSTIGNYSLYVTDTISTCQDSAQTIVESDNSLPIPDSIFIEQPDCFGNSFGSIQVSSINGGTAPYLISFDGGAFTAETQFNNLNAGLYSIEIEDAIGCTYEVSDLSIAALGSFFVAFPDSQIITHVGEQVLLEAALIPSSTVLDSVHWSSIVDTSTTNPLAQYYEAKESRRFVLTAIDTAGCRSQTSVLVLVKKERRVFIPTIFSPSGSENDLFLIYVGEDVEEVEFVQVFSRWGELVFEKNAVHANSPDDGWDGRHNGKKVLPGVYVSKVAVRFKDGERIIYHTDLTVLR